jgi:hypothetical protein
MGGVARPVGLPDHQKAFRIGKWHGANQYRIHDTQHGRRHANAQREGQYGHDGESGVSAFRPDR